MKKIRIIALVLVIFMIATTIIGCNDSNDNNNDSVNNNESKNQTDSKNSNIDDNEEEAVTINYLSWAGADEQKDQNTATEDFQKEFENITVEAQFVPYGEYHSKINTLIAADTTPDVYYINEYLAVDWGEKGVAADLKPLFLNDGIKMEEVFIPNALFQNAEGNIYGLASGVVNQMLFFNKRCLMKLDLIICRRIQKRHIALSSL